jgi:hypothetical protein
MAQEAHRRGEEAQEVAAASAAKNDDMAFDEVEQPRLSVAPQSAS